MSIEEIAEEMIAEYEKLHLEETGEAIKLPPGHPIRIFYLAIAQINFPNPNPKPPI